MDNLEQREVEQSEVDFQWYLAERCPHKSEEEKEREECERINNLTLTAADVERAIYEAKGMDFDDLVQFVIDTNIVGFDVKRLKIELKANNFYRGHKYVNMIGQMLGYTSNDMDYLFENKKFPDKEIIEPIEDIEQTEEIKEINNKEEHEN